MYSIILQNNTSKKIYRYDRLSDMSDNNLYIKFEDFYFTQGEPDGEYTYYLYWNDREDVEYEYSEVPINTVLKTGEGNVTLKDLQPLTGLLRIGKLKSNTIYRKNNERNEYLYRK